MAFSLANSVSILIPNPAGALVDFTVQQSVNDIWIANNGGANRDVSLWFDYDGTNATNTELFMDTVQVPRNDFIHVTGLWVFNVGGRITGLASVSNEITFHLSRANL